MRESSIGSISDLPVFYGQLGYACLFDTPLSDHQILALNNIDCDNAKRVVELGEPMSWLFHPQVHPFLVGPRYLTVHRRPKAVFVMI